MLFKLYTSNKGINDLSISRILPTSNETISLLLEYILPKFNWFFILVKILISFLCNPIEKRALTWGNFLPSFSLIVRLKLPSAAMKPAIQ